LGVGDRCRLTSNERLIGHIPTPPAFFAGVALSQVVDADEKRIKLIRAEEVVVGENIPPKPLTEGLNVTEGAAAALAKEPMTWDPVKKVFIKKSDAESNGRDAPAAEARNGKSEAPAAAPSLAATLGVASSALAVPFAVGGGTKGSGDDFVDEEPAANSQVHTDGSGFI